MYEYDERKAEHLRDGKQYSKDLFVHIPKTAGSSISKILNNNNLDNWNRAWPRHHDPYFYLKDTNNIDSNVFSFSVVRNPYKRTYSCFKEFNRTNGTNILFLEYLNNILQNIISPNTPLLHLPQSFYILEDNKLQVNKAYRFENLQELELDFGWKLGNYNVGNYKIDSYVNDYNKEAVDIVKELYKTDFSFFEYSLDFDQTMEKKWERP